MDLTYLALLLIVLVGYVAYSLWARLDSRYLLGAALLVLIAATVVQAFGDSGAADDLALDTFVVFLAGLVLVVLDRGFSDRRTRRELARPVRAAEPAGQPSDPR